MAWLGRGTLSRKFASAAGFVGLLLASDYALHYPKGKREFKRESVEGTLMEALRTGDVMLFTRSPKEFHPLKLMSLFLAKRHGPYDHVGVIIRNDQEELPYVLEYTFNGIEMTPFDQRVLCGSDTDMTLRRVYLTPPGDLAKRKDLEQWAATLVEKKENMGYLRLLARQLNAEWNASPSRPAALARVVEAEARLAEEPGKKALQDLLQMEKNSWETIDHKPATPTGSPSAELVATALQRLQVLPSRPLASSYLPNDFANALPSSDIPLELVTVIERGRPRPKFDKPW